MYLKVQKEVVLDTDCKFHMLQSFSLLVKTWRKFFPIIVNIIIN